MNAHEKAIATYEAIQAIKKARALVNLEVAKLARNKDKEALEYHQDKVNKIRRRKL